MDQITFSKAIDGYLIAANARRLSAHTLADYSTTFRKPAQHLKTDVYTQRLSGKLDFW